MQLVELSQQSQLDSVQSCWWSTFSGELVRDNIRVTTAAVHVNLMPLPSVILTNELSLLLQKQ